MFTVTDGAIAKVAEMIENAQAPKSVALRIVAKGEETFGMRMDGAKPGDTTFDHDGKTVLVLDKEVSESLKERMLDVKNTKKGAELVLV
jgi:Fe-S cluster assembly iron-binding protein IscA